MRNRAVFEGKIEGGSGGGGFPGASGKGSPKEGSAWTALALIGKRDESPRGILPPHQGSKHERIGERQAAPEISPTPSRFRNSHRRISCRFCRFGRLPQAHEKVR